MEIVDELNREFFGQEFACSDQTSRSEVLEHYKRLAGVYAVNFHRTKPSS